MSAPSAGDWGPDNIHVHYAPQLDEDHNFTGVWYVYATVEGKSQGKTLSSGGDSITVANGGSSVTVENDSGTLGLKASWGPGSADVPFLTA